MPLSQQSKKSIRKDKSLDDTLTFSCKRYHPSTGGCVYLVYHGCCSSKEVRCSMLCTMHKRAHTRAAEDIFFYLHLDVFEDIFRVNSGMVTALSLIGVKSFL